MPLRSHFNVTVLIASNSNYLNWSQSNQSFKGGSPWQHQRDWRRRQRQWRRHQLLQIEPLSPAHHLLPYSSLWTTTICCSNYLRTICTSFIPYKVGCIAKTNFQMSSKWGPMQNVCASYKSLRNVKRYSRLIDARCLFHLIYQNFKECSVCIKVLVAKSQKWPHVVRGRKSRER